jgi:hypothetical protein
MPLSYFNIAYCMGKFAVEWSQWKVIINKTGKV